MAIIYPYYFWDKLTVQVIPNQAVLGQQKYNVECCGSWIATYTDKYDSTKWSPGMHFSNRQIIFLTDKSNATVCESLHRIDKNR